MTKKTDFTFLSSAGKPRLHRDGLVHLIEAEELIEALSHIQRDAALDGPL